MRWTTFLFLIVVTAVVGWAAYWAWVEQQQAHEASAPAATDLFGNFASRVNEVARITARSAEATVTVGRNADGVWTVAEKGDYPANPDKVRETVLGLAGLAVVEPMTANPDYFDRLGLRDVAVEGSKAVEVTLADGAGTALATVLRGDTRDYASGSQPGTFYVRMPGEDQTWLVEGTFQPAADPVEWIDKSVPEVTRERVMRLEVHHPDGTAFSASRADPDGTLALDTPPEGAEVKTSEVNRIAGALAYFYFDDVRPADPATEAVAVTLTLRTFDGLVVTARTVRERGETGDDDDGGDGWVTFSAELDEALATAAAEAARTATAEAGGDEAETTEDDPLETLRAEVAGITDRHAGWAYKVSSYSADTLTRRLGDVIEEPEPDAAE